MPIQGDGTHDTSYLPGDTCTVSAYYNLYDSGKNNPIKSVYVLKGQKFKKDSALGNDQRYRFKSDK